MDVQFTCGGAGGSGGDDQTGRGELRHGDRSKSPRSDRPDDPRTAVSEHASGRLVVLSGPSGVGKTTVLRKLFARAPVDLVSSVSATTRPMRPGEQDGVDYHFLSADEFESRRSDGAFLECAEVFGRGFWYGTLWSEVTPRLGRGQWVLLEIDVEGALHVMEQFPAAITIFIQPPSGDELESRLRGRATESEEIVLARLTRARAEMALADRYKHQVVNRHNAEDHTVDELCRILATYETIHSHESPNQGEERR